MLQFLRNHKRRLVGLLLILIILGVALRVANSFMEPAHQLGVTDGLLAACPDSPNCVCTHSDRDEHKIAPIEFSGSTDKVLDLLESIVKRMPRTEIVTRRDDYLHVEFRTFWMGYVDDVEFLIDETAGLVHFRSASRTGYSDLGVNRARMEEIRKLYLEK